MTPDDLVSYPPAAAPPEKRKAGAPAGNLNALKHGFYSSRFREQETLDLDKELPEHGLQDEIKLLKVIIRRVFYMAEDEGNDDLDNWIKVLRACGSAMVRQASLLQAQQKLGGFEDAAGAISRAIAEVSREFTSK